MTCATKELKLFVVPVVWNGKKEIHIVVATSSGEAVLYAQGYYYDQHRRKPEVSHSDIQERAIPTEGGRLFKI